jgi:parvulin-like peptidyl-prolyl isomerase
MAEISEIRLTRGRRKFVALAACALLIASLAIVGLATQTAKVGGVVAEVNGHPISERELKRMLADPTMLKRAQRRGLQQRVASASEGSAQRDQLQEQSRHQLERIALRRLILVRLLLEEADRLELKVTDDDLANAHDAVRRGFEDASSFAEWRKALDVADDRSLADALRTELLVERVSAVLAKDVAVRPGEAEAYYRARKAEFTVPETVRLSIIETGDQTSTDQILQELKQPGADFAAVARQRSKGFRAEGGGDFGWVPIDRLQSQLRATVASMQPGQIGGPVRTEGGPVIVKLFDRRPARPRELAEVQGSIEQALLRARQREAMRDWLEEREKDAKVEILVSTLRPDAAGAAMSATGSTERAAVEQWLTSPKR